MLLPVRFGVDHHRVAHELGAGLATIVRTEARVVDVNLAEADEVRLWRSGRAAPGYPRDTAEPVEVTLGQALRLVAVGCNAAGCGIRPVGRCPGSTSPCALLSCSMTTLDADALSMSSTVIIQEGVGLVRRKLQVGYHPPPQAQ